MTKTLFVLITMLSFSITLSAQSDTIVARKVFGGYKYLQDATPLTPKMMLDLMVDNQDAYVLMSHAKTRTVVASVFSYAGGFMIGWSIGAAIAGDEINWSQTGVGAGLITLGIMAAGAASKDAIAAIEIYNSKLKSSQREGMKLNLGIHDHGVGLALKF